MLQTSKQVSKTFLMIGLLLTVVYLAACRQTGDRVTGESVTGDRVDVEATVAAGVVATQQAGANLQATIDAAVAATLQAQPTSEPTAATAANASAQATELEQVRTVILNEVGAAVSQDLGRLQSLYAPNAVVIDRNGTPADPGDDTIWQGWANIQRRYQAFFSAKVTSMNLVDLSIQVNNDQATGTHRGVVLNGIYSEDLGNYSLEKIDGAWLITQLEYGNLSRAASSAGTGAEASSGDSLQLVETIPQQPPAEAARDDGLYTLELGSQHRYEEPWGWDRGNPCEAWQTGNFDDTKPNYRGFNVELLLTNHSDKKIPDQWPISFTTAKGQSVQACYYAYAGSGPPPKATSSVTFFTVVEKGDYVEKITLDLEGQIVQLCLDGRGGWSNC